METLILNPIKMLGGDIGLLILDLSNGDNLEYVLPLGGSGKINLGLSRRSDGAFKICTNNKLAEITTVSDRKHFTF